MNNTTLPNISNFNKIYNNNGRLCYPKLYFNPNISKMNLNKTYPSFNDTQKKHVVKYDKFNNKNYIKNEVFYITNNNYSSIKF
jgi:hypothetical protein